jgi:hypothetical protein
MYGCSIKCNKITHRFPSCPTHSHPQLFCSTVDLVKFWIGQLRSLCVFVCACAPPRYCPPPPATYQYSPAPPPLQQWVNQLGRSSSCPRASASVWRCVITCAVKMCVSVQDPRLLVMLSRSSSCPSASAYV